MPVAPRCGPQDRHRPRLRPGGGRAHRRVGTGRGSAARRSARSKLARFGDNMRDVAVTEGDKVEAQLRFGVSVNTYGVNDLVAVVDADQPTPRSTTLVDGVRGPLRRRRRAAQRRLAARVAALRRADRARPADLPHRGRLQRVHHQLRGPRRPAPASGPGGAAAHGRRLRLRRRGRLEDLGPAPDAEGDGLPGGGTSFMEDYTYHLTPDEELDPRAPTCWRSARASPAGKPSLRDPPARHRRPGGPGPAGLRRGPRARRSSSAWPTWASGSAWWPTRSTWSPRRSPCPTSRWPAPSGSLARTCAPRRSRG